MTLPHRRGFLRTAAVTLAVPRPAAVRLPLTLGAAARAAGASPRASPPASRPARDHAVDEARRRRAEHGARRRGRRDADFRSVLHRQAVVDPALGGTARVRIGGRPLRPGEQYFYRFSTLRRDPRPSAASAPRGRPTRASRCASAFFSCQEFEAGFYTRARAPGERGPRRRRLPRRLHLRAALLQRRRAAAGARRRTAAHGRRRRRRSPSTARSTRSTTPTRGCCEVRRQVPADRDLGRPRGRGQLRRRTSPATRPRAPAIPFARAPRATATARSSSTCRALAPREPDRTYGRSRSAHAELFLLDQRQYRDDQPCSDDRSLVPCPAPRPSGPARTLLGARAEGVAQGRARAVAGAWKVVANQVMIMSLDGAAAQRVNKDPWDGYAAERRSCSSTSRAGIKDVTFITGDIHTFFAGDVTRDRREGCAARPAGRRRATEFVGGSITSRGDRRPCAGASRAGRRGRAARRRVRANNPHIATPTRRTRATACCRGVGRRGGSLRSCQLPRAARDAPTRRVS